MTTLTLARLFFQLLGFYSVFTGLSVVFAPILTAAASLFSPGAPGTGWIMFGFSFCMAASPLLLGCALIWRADWIAKKVCISADEPVVVLGYAAADFESLCFSLLGVFVLVNETPHFVRFLSSSFIELGRQPSAPLDMTPLFIDLAAHATTIFLGVFLLLRARKFGALLALLRK